jgi:branched-chain amino acid transport system permease protein
VLLGDIVLGLAIGSTYALAALGIVLIYSGTRALSIAVGEIGAFGLYLALSTKVPGLRGTLGGPAQMGIAIAVGAVLGLVVERVVMRPLVRRPPLDALIATLGVALFLALLEFRVFGADPLFPKQPFGEGYYEVFGTRITRTQVGALVCVVLVAFALYLFLNRTSFGLATRAATGDPTVARLLGVKVGSVYRFAWVTAGALGGLSAVLISSAEGTLSPFAQTGSVLRALAGAVIGGLDSLWGAILGCLVVGVVQTVVQSNVHLEGADSVAVLVLVLVTLTLRPNGILGSARAA